MSDQAWYNMYLLRYERNGDIPLYSSEADLNINSKSKLSPITNIVLNSLSIKNNRSNFIICFPSSSLRPLPIISYILAKKSNASVLVFTSDNRHFTNYHLIKREYQFIWNDVPAGILDDGSIHVNPKVPSYAKRDFKKQLKAYIPTLKQKFLETSFSKILFYLNRNLKFSDSFQDLFVGNENVIALSNLHLGIKTIIFENFDNIIFNNYLFDTFKEWIKPLKSKDRQFIFHISNPDYKYLTNIRELFQTYVLYFPYSFLKSNEDLYQKNKHYFAKLAKKDQNSHSVINEFNLEHPDIYSKTIEDNIQVRWTLKKGNIDVFFRNGIDLLSTLEWSDVNKALRSVIYKIRHLFYCIYKNMCIPREFTIKYYDDQYGIKYYNLNRFFSLASKIIDVHSSSKTKDILKNILTYIVNMVNELSECKRFGEEESYSRIGKNYILCDYLHKSSENENFLIGVQHGEQKALQRLLDEVESKAKFRLKSLNQLARGIGDYSEYTLILSGRLLPSNIQILFKNWKNIIFLVYKGNNHRWVKQQIKMIFSIDISKEELTLKYLSQIIKELIAGPNYDIRKDSLFSNFLKKKERLISLEMEDYGLIESNEEISSIFDKDVKLTTTTIKELCGHIMKSDPRYKDFIAEVMAKKSVKEDNLEKRKKLEKSVELFDCICNVKNEISGIEQVINLDTKKRYMYFRDKNKIKIEYGFPHSLSNKHYLVLFGTIDRLSATEFIKNAFVFEDDIEYDKVSKWQANLSDFYNSNYIVYKKFYDDYVGSCTSTISYQEFIKWVKGEVNAPLDPENLRYIGNIMNDSFIIQNFELICKEARKIQKFHLRISKLLKKLIAQVLVGDVLRKDCSIEELGLLDEIENCIFKIKDIQIKI